MRKAHARVAVYPYRVVACACADVNCRGWRLVSPLDHRLELEARLAEGAGRGREKSTSERADA